MIESLPENTESKEIFMKGKVDCKLAEGREEVHGGIRYIHIHPVCTAWTLLVCLFQHELGLNRSPVLISVARKVSHGRRTTSPTFA